MKSKKFEPWTLSWFDAWKKLLGSEVVIRAEIEFRVQCVDFSAILMYMEKGIGIYQINCDRSLGASIDVPKTTLTRYDAPPEAYLQDMYNYWAHSPRRFPADNWVKPVSHAAIVQPFLGSHIHSLPSLHSLLLPYYGMVLERLREERRRTDETIERRIAWETFERRFKVFLTQQEFSVLENTVGYVQSL